MYIFNVLQRCTILSTPLLFTQNEVCSTTFCYSISLFHVFFNLSVLYARGYLQEWAERTPAPQSPLCLKALALRRRFRYVNTRQPLHQPRADLSVSLVPRDSFIFLSHTVEQRIRSLRCSSANIWLHITLGHSLSGSIIVLLDLWRCIMLTLLSNDIYVKWHLSSSWDFV